MTDLNARISQLEADLSGARFAAAQHLTTVEAQAKQIAELTACVAAHKRSVIDHAKRQDADLVDPALRGRPEPVAAPRLPHAEPYGYWKDGEWYGFCSGENPDCAEGETFELTPVWTHGKDVTFRCVAVPDSDDFDYVPHTPEDAALLARFADLGAATPAQPIADVSAGATNWTAIAHTAEGKPYAWAADVSVPPAQKLLNAAMAFAKEHIEGDALHESPIASDDEIGESDGRYNETKRLLCDAYLELQACGTADVSAPTDSIRQLMKFYSAATLEELIETQAKHVERLQAKLPSTQQPAFTRVREG